jgi:predicted RNA binding protein with dsRBD fold (UPF0201 family)
MDEVNIAITVDVNPTEDPDKVKMAVENMFGPLEFKTTAKRRGSLLIAKTTGRESLSKLHNLLRRERIRDAARRALFQGLSKDAVSFYLNKQVAYAGHVSFSEPMAESPLGPISVEIQCDNPRELVDWLAPRTTK